MAELFFSFIHEDHDDTLILNIFVRNILRGIKGSFMSSDQSMIYAGEDWMKRIFSALQECKVLISVLTPQSIGRPWINFEAGAAWMSGKVVIPVCFGDLKIGNLPKPYSSLQAVEVETFDGAYYLVSSLAHHFGIPEPEKPFFTEDSTGMRFATPEEAENNSKLSIPYKRFIRDIRSNRSFKDWPSEK